MPWRDRSLFLHAWVRISSITCAWTQPNCTDALASFFPYVLTKSLPTLATVCACTVHGEIEPTT